MATIRASLSLTSPDVLTSPLAISIDSNLLVDSGGLVRATVKGTAADSNDLVIYKANDKETQAFLFIETSLPVLKTIFTSATRQLEILPCSQKWEAVNSHSFLFRQIRPWLCMLPLPTLPMEYGIFGKDNTNVSLGGSGT